MRNMATKVDIQKLESYSIALSEKLCNDYYQAGRTAIKGEDILRFTPIEQLNLFIIKNLSERWKEEAQKLRSPYFDYEEEAVKDALTTFLNKLSRHISVRKEFFKPLLKKSVADTIAYLVEPYSFLKAELAGKRTITLAELKDKEKYIRVNKVLFQELIKNLQPLPKVDFSEAEVLHTFENVYTQLSATIEPGEKYIHLFSEILKISVDDISLFANSTTATTLVAKNEIPENISAAPEEPKPVQQFAEPAQKPLKEENARPATINDYFARNKQLTLNEMLMKETDSTILSIHRKSKIEDLNTAVSINLRYLFINELFKGGADDYNQALVQIERCENLAAARIVVDEHYARKYNWDVAKPEVKEFYELIERRFY
jgi:hypothetical protein